MLVGYSANSKAFICWNKQTGHIIVLRNVHFIDSKDARPHTPYPEYTLPNNNLNEDNDEHPHTLTSLEGTHTPHIEIDEPATDRPPPEPDETPEILPQWSKQITDAI